MSEVEGGDGMTTLADELPRQMKRVREEVLPAYEELIGMPRVNPHFAIASMKHALTEAEKAAAAGDVVAMIRWCEELKGFDT